MEPIYLTKNIFLAKVTNPVFVKFSKFLGLYEKGNICLSVIVNKKGNKYYNLLNNEVYSDDPYGSVDGLIIYEKLSLNTKKTYYTWKCN